MSIFVLHFGQSNLFFLGGSCMSENLKTWGKCANPFFTWQYQFIVNKLQNYLFRFKMRQTRLYINAYEDYVYPSSSFSYHQKSYLPKQISSIVQPIWWWTK